MIWQRLIFFLILFAVLTGKAQTPENGFSSSPGDIELVVSSVVSPQAPARPILDEKLTVLLEEGGRLPAEEILDLFDPNQQGEPALSRRQHTARYLHYLTEKAPANVWASLPALLGALSLGGIAAYGEAVVFGNNPAVGTFIALDQESVEITGYSSLGVIVLPAVVTARRHFMSMTPPSEEQKAVKASQSRAYQILWWANNALAAGFSSVAAKKYWESTFGSLGTNGKPSYDGFDYVTLPVYVIFSFFNQREILQSNLRLFAAGITGYFTPPVEAEKEARLRLQSRLARAYRKVHAMKDRDLLDYLLFLKALGKNARTAEEKQVAALGQLLYLYGLDEAGTHTHTKAPKAFTWAGRMGATFGSVPFILTYLLSSCSTFQGFSIPHPEAEPRGGNVTAGNATAVNATAPAGAAAPEYFSLGNNPFCEGADLAGAIPLALYTAGVGAFAGKKMFENLYLRFTNQNPNMWQETTLVPFRESHAGCRAVMSTVSYAAATWFSIPTTSLGTGMIFENMGWTPETIRLMKASLVGSLGYGLQLHNFFDRGFQDMITLANSPRKKVSAYGDPMGTLRDEALDGIRRLSYGIGGLKGAVVVALAEDMASLSEKRGEWLEKRAHETRETPFSARASKEEPFDMSMLPAGRESEESRTSSGETVVNPLHLRGVDAKETLDDVEEGKGGFHFAAGEEKAGEAIKVRLFSQGESKEEAPGKGLDSLMREAEMEEGGPLRKSRCQAFMKWAGDAASRATGAAREWLFGRLPEEALYGEIEELQKKKEGLEQMQRHIEQKIEKMKTSSNQSVDDLKKEIKMFLDSVRTEYNL